MPLASVAPLDTMRLILTRVELADRQEHAMGRVIICAVEPGALTRQPLDEAFAGGFVTTAAVPAHQVPHLIQVDHYRPALWLEFLR